MYCRQGVGLGFFLRRETTKVGWHACEFYYFGEEEAWGGFGRGGSSRRLSLFFSEVALYCLLLPHQLELVFGDTCNYYYYFQKAGSTSSSTSRHGLL